LKLKCSTFFQQEADTRIFSPSTFKAIKQGSKPSETPRKKGNKRLSDSTPSKFLATEIEEKLTGSTTATAATTATTTIEGEVEAESHKTKRTKLQRLSVENKENIPEQQTTAGFSKQLKLD